MAGSRSRGRSGRRSGRSGVGSCVFWSCFEAQGDIFVQKVRIDVYYFLRGGMCRVCVRSVEYLVEIEHAEFPVQLKVLSSKIKEQSVEYYSDVTGT